MAVMFWVMETTLKRLTGALAWTLAARARRTLTFHQVSNPECVSVDDWRKNRAKKTGTLVA